MENVMTNITLPEQLNEVQKQLLIIFSYCSDPQAFAELKDVLVKYYHDNIDENGNRRDPDPDGLDMALYI
jgi:hypothetical protein